MIYSRKLDQSSLTQLTQDNKILSGHIWEELRVFLAVSKFKSFNRASEHLNISHPTVSRHVKRLEDVMGIKLLISTKQGISLTNAGRSLADSIGEIDEQIYSITNKLKLFNSSSVNDICISIPFDFEQKILNNWIRFINDIHPNKNIHIKTYYGGEDYNDDTFDIAIRYIDDKSHPSHSLGFIKYQPAASKKYIDKWGEPNKCNLTKHKFITLKNLYSGASGFDEWENICKVGHSSCSCDNMHINKMMVKNGAGIGLINKLSDIDKVILPLDLGIEISTEIHLKYNVNRKKNTYFKDMHKILSLSN